MISSSASDYRTVVRRWKLNAIFTTLVVIQVLGLTYSIALSSIAFTGAALLFVVLFFAERNFVRFKNGLEWCILAWILAVSIMVIFATYPATAFYQSRHSLLLSVIYFMPLAFSTAERREWFVAAIVATAASQSFIEILIFYSEDFARLGYFQHYMTSAGIKMIAVLLALPLILSKESNRKARIVASVAAPITLFALLLTQTRSSWMAFIVGAVIIGAVRYRTVLVGIALVIVLAVVFASGALKERMSQMFSLKQDPGNYTSTIASNQYRIRMWQTGWQMFLDYPITGIGDGEMYVLYRKYVPDAHELEGGHLHNSYIHILATHGAVGFLAFVVLLTVMLVRIGNSLRRSIRSRDGTIVLGGLAVLIGCMVNALTEHSFGDHEILVLVWSAVGLAIAAGKDYERRENVRPTL